MNPNPAPRGMHPMLLLLLLLPAMAAALSGFEVQSLMRLPKLLGSPSALSGWGGGSNVSFCALQSSRLVNVSCGRDSGGGETVLVLQIIGDKLPISVEQKLSANYTESQVRLPDDFSIQTLANTLIKFPNLQVLKLVSLGIWGLLPPSLDHLRSLQVLNLSSNFLAGSIPDRYSALGSLQSLAIDNNILTGTFPASLNVLPNLDTLELSDNRITGTVPAEISLFTSLKTLSMSHNQLFGVLPDSISNMHLLQTLSLPDNLLTGNLPNLTSVSTLRYLDLSSNQLGPSFPTLGDKLVTVKLSRNRISASLPGSLQSFSDLQLLNVSVNSISGSAPGWIFSLPSLQILALDHNRLSGALPGDLSLGGQLRVVDISSNLFRGSLPKQLSSGGSLTVAVDENCLADLNHQQPEEYCIKAERMVPSQPSGSDQSGGGGSSSQPSGGGGKKKKWKGGVVAGIAGGVMAVGAAATVLLVILLRFSKQGKFKNAAAAAHCGDSSCADTASVGVPTDLLQSTRYLAQSGTVGATGPPQCRVFSLLELEEATNHFTQSGFVGEGEYGKVYKGRLDDGTMVAVKVMLIDPRQEIKQFKAHLEFLSRIRHRHLVSLLGYCLEREKEGQPQRRLFLVSEFIDHGTLRSHLFKRRLKESVSWQNRLVAVLGAGRGIHYLHTGVVPGIFNNDVRITNILLDQNFVAKVSDFGLAKHPDSEAGESYGSDQVNQLLSQNSVAYIDLDHHRRKLATDKKDVYNFGLVLLEIVLGRPPTVDNFKAVKPKVQELEMMMTDSVFRTEMVDSTISGTCSEDSLSTVLEIAAKCLSDDPAARPSMEDVMWNLQYAVQVQERRLSGDLHDELNGGLSKE